MRFISDITVSLKPYSKPGPLVNPEQLFHRKEGLLLDYNAEFVADAVSEGVFKPKADPKHLESFPKMDPTAFPASDFPTLTYDEHAQIRAAISTKIPLSSELDEKLKDIYSRNKALIVLSMSGGEPRGLSDLYLRVCMQTRCVRFMRSDQILLWVTSMEAYRAVVSDEELDVLKKAPQYKAKQAVVNFAPLRDRFLDIACVSVFKRFVYSREVLGAPWVLNHEFYIMLEAIRQVVFSDGVSSPLNRLLDKYQQVIKIQDTLRLYGRQPEDDSGQERRAICRKLAQTRHLSDPKEISDYIIQSFASWVPTCRGLSSQMRRKTDETAKAEVQKRLSNYEDRFYTRTRSYADKTLHSMSKWLVDPAGEFEENLVNTPDLLTDIVQETKFPYRMRGKVQVSGGGSLEAVYDGVDRPTNVLSRNCEIIARASDDPPSLFIKHGDFSRVVSVINDSEQKDLIQVQIPFREDSVVLPTNFNNCDFLNANGVRFSSANRASKSIPAFADHLNPFKTPFSDFYTPTSFHSPLTLDTILIDISGPYPMTLSGCQWLLVILDYSSRGVFTITAKSLAALNKELANWLEEAPKRIHPDLYGAAHIVNCIQYHGPDSSPAAPYHKPMPNSPRKALLAYCMEKQILLQDYQGMRYSRFHSSSQSERQTTQVVEELVLVPARTALWESNICESRKEQLWDYATEFIVQKHNHLYDVHIGSYVVDWSLPPNPYGHLIMSQLLRGSEDRKHDVTREVYHEYVFGKALNPGFWVLKCIGKMLYVYDENNNTVVSTDLKNQI